MAIVTIARERGAMGQLVAAELAHQLGYRLIDRQVVEEALEADGFTEKNVSAYDEKKPGFFAQVSNMMEEYIRGLKTLVYREAAKGDCVFLGRGTQFLLQNVPGVVRIRLVAPLATRIARVSKLLDLDERAAEQQIHHIDRDRSQFNEHFFDSKWDAAINYNAVLNTQGLVPEQVVRIIRSILAEASSPELEAAGKIMAHNLATGQLICRHLLHDLQLPLYFLEAEVKDDTVILHGLAHSMADIDKARENAAIEGVRNVISNLTIGRMMR
ncbi:MAG: cytidylate kinase-like family protein [Victivallales bacterium]|nr:cytidylate kinase-like family protein [Victivallales bacterium]